MSTTTPADGATRSETKSTPVLAPHEAHVHALGLLRGAQPEAGGVGPHLGLRELADRQQRAAQLRLAEHVEDVRLVLGRVDATTQPERPAASRAHPRVVPGGERVEPERLGPVEQLPELDRPVALDARVRRAFRRRTTPRTAPTTAASNSSLRLNT